MTRRFTRPLLALLAAGSLGAAALSVPAANAASAPLPTSFRLASTTQGLALFWNGHGAATFEVQQATDETMDTDLVTYTIDNGYTQFSPYEITAGQTYYFRVQAGTGSAVSGYTETVTGAPVTTMQPVRVMTYNILEHSADGGGEGDGPIAQWAKRRPGVAALIRKQMPDVVAVEETASWIGPISRHVRQIDSLETELGSPYKIAPTEKTYPTHGWFRTGVNILYNSSAWALGQRTGHFSIGNKKWGAYQVLINRTTGARFVFVATHLIPGNSSSLEAIRQQETEKLFTTGHNLSVATGYPVIYAGDFNAATKTDPHFTYDSTRKAANQFHNDDAFFIAQSRINPSYDSANLYLHKPPRSSDRIDRIFASPGVGVIRAGIELHLVNGRIPSPIPSDHNPLWADLDFPYGGS